MSFYPLKVAHVTAETHQAKTIIFDVPAEQGDTFSWKTGQHLTLRLDIDGTPVKRAYTISSSPYSGQALGITVKKPCLMPGSTRTTFASRVPVVPARPHY